PLTSHRRQVVRAALNRGALHVVQDAADTAELLAATSTAWAAMDQVWQWGTMAGGSLRIHAVQEVHAAVVGSNAAAIERSQFIIVSNNRSHQRTGALRSEIDCLSRLVVANDRNDRAKRLDRVHSFGLGIIETHNGWCEECAVELVGAAVDDLAAGIDKLVHCRCHIVTLLDRDQRSHRGILIARIAGHNLGLVALRQRRDEWL